MRPSGSLTAPQLFTRRFATNPLASVLVACLVLVTAAVAAVVPRLVERQDTAELTYQLQSIGPVARSLSGSGDFHEAWLPELSPDRDQIYGHLNDAFAQAPHDFGSALRPAVGSAQWLIQAPTLTTDLVNASAQRLGLRLTADQNYLARVRVVSGRAPAVWTGNDSGSAISVASTPIEVLLSVTAARSLHLAVGDTVTSKDVDGEPQPRYRVTGLYQPRDPSAQYWAQNPSLVPATLVKPNVGASYLSGAAFVDPLSVGGLAGTFSSARISLYYPMRAAAADGADAELLRRQVAAVISAGITMPGDGSTPMSITTGAGQAIETAVQRGAILAGFLALLAAAPLGVTLAVLGLGVQAVVQSRRRDIALAIARGAGSLQVRGAMAIEGLLLSVPATAIATALAVLLLPGRWEASAFVLPALVAITPGILFAVLPVTEESTRSRARLSRQLRGVAEVAVILLAAVALLLLTRRGLAEATAQVGIDPLLVATPLLLSVSVGILVLRAYPFPLRAARLRAVRSRGLAGFVGSIRATRTPTVGLVGVLALVVGISIAIFSTVMLSTFDGATERAAAASVGADLRVDGTAFSPTQRDAVDAVPGIRAVAGVQHLDARFLRGTGVIDTVGVLVAQTDPLRRLRPSLATGLGTATGGRIPVVVSSDLASELRGHGNDTLDGVPIRVVGTLPADSQLGPTHGWILVDSAFAQRFTAAFTPDLLLVRADPQRLTGLRALVTRAVGSTATVVTVASVAAERRDEPAVGGIRIALLAGAAISVLLCAIALVLATIVAGRARARTAGILRTLGLRSRKLRVLVAWELAPVVALAVIAGTALGVVLPLIVTAAVDLRPFAGGTVRPVPSYDPGLLGLVLAVFCVVVAIVGVIAVAAGERLNPSTTLKMGAE
ncbi:MAG: putative transport system permease protein [Actinomycetota bacterium]|jgi:putative ABC transport system permease protein|nr:putative transport system permease protein [Actinomycetota bacterium]